MPSEYQVTKTSRILYNCVSLQLHVLTQNCDDLSEIWLVCWLLIGEWVSKGNGIGPCLDLLDSHAVERSRTRA